MISTVERARGRWAEILPRLGIDTGFLRNKHGPCPLCGGKDRFRYDDRHSNGDYYCNQCGAGIGIILVRKKHGWDFATACREIDSIIGTDSPVAPRAAPSTASPDTRRAKIERVLEKADDPSIVRRYLASRGLSVTPAILRGHPNLPYYDAADGLKGYFPAVIAPIVGPDGKLQSVQRIYVGDLDPRKKIMAPVETIRGGAVRLFDLADAELGLCEGVENAIAVNELFGIATWAALSTSGMEAFEPPAGLQHLTIFADNDTNFAGLKSAYVLAARQSSIVPNISVRPPPEPGSDWLDELNERRRWATA